MAGYNTGADRGTAGCLPGGIKEDGRVYGPDDGRHIKRNQRWTMKKNAHAAETV